MTIHQSEHGKGRRIAPTPEQAGQVTCAIFEHSFAAAFAFATDKLELGVLPAEARIVDVVAVPTGLNGNITIGIMSGTPGVADDARTSGAEIFSAQAMVSTPIRMSAATGFNIAEAVIDRSIGLTGSADIAADANKTIKLFVYYIL